MADRRRVYRTLRWILSVLLVTAGLSTVWAWGRVARLAEPSPTVESEPPVSMLYAAWQPAAGTRAVLFRSADRGDTWQPVPLKTGIAGVAAWADDGGDSVAVALCDGTVLRSGNRGERWTSVSAGMPVLSLAFGLGGDLYIGTAGQGIWRQAGRGKPEPVATTDRGLAGASVRHLAVSGQRLFAATLEAIFYSDDSGKDWTSARLVPGRVSALSAVDAQTLFVGTEGSGILKSSDAGLTWQPVVEGLGQAAGVALAITALRADTAERAVLYASVTYLVGGTQLHAAPAGTFVTLDGGASWLKLAGPSFPEAKLASDLVLVPSRPLTALAATPEGLQGYVPDVAGALAALASGTAPERTSATRLLGLARPEGAGDALLSALTDPDSGVSQAAADALGLLHDPATVPYLEAALDSRDRQVQRNAARALGLMRVESAIQPLAAMLFQGETTAAGAVAEALRQIGSPAAAQALVAALADPKLTVRRQAALGALEALGEPAVGPLVGMLASQDGASRRNAAEALGWIGSASATGALVKALGDGTEVVRSEAAWALGEIGDPSAQRALARTRSGDPSVVVREAAGLALAQIGSVSATRVSGWTAWIPILSRYEEARWPLLILALFAAALLVARNAQPSPVRVARRSRGR